MSPKLTALLAVAAAGLVAQPAAAGLQYDTWQDRWDHREVAADNRGGESGGLTVTYTGGVADRAVTTCAFESVGVPNTSESYFVLNGTAAVTTGRDNAVAASSTVYCRLVDATGATVLAGAAAGPSGLAVTGPRTVRRRYGVLRVCVAGEVWWSSGPLVTPLPEACADPESPSF